VSNSDQYATVGHCRVEDCGKPMLSKWAWEGGVRREGHVSAGAHGMCRKHHVRWLRTGQTELLPRTSVRRARTSENFRGRQEVLEDYLLIKDDVASVREAAERMGMTFSALDMALYRARKDGHEEASPPLKQIERTPGRRPRRAA